MGNRSRNTEQQKIEKDRIRQKKIDVNSLNKSAEDQKSADKDTDDKKNSAKAKKSDGSMVLEGNERGRILFCSLIVMAVLIILDQITKDLMIKNYSVGEGMVIIKGFLELLHIKNKGSAWGIFNDKPVVPILISCVLILLILFVYKNIIKYRKYKSLRICIVFLLSGALSNIIDRIRIGSVTDFVYFKWLDFPVFNVADIYVTISMMVMLILLIFSYKGSDLDVMLGNGYLDNEGNYKDKYNAE